MTLQNIALLASIVANVVGIVIITWLWGKLREKAPVVADLEAQLRGQIDQLAVAREQVAVETETQAAALRSLHEERAEKSRALTAALTADRDAFKRRSEEYFKSIESACRERDLWRNWYYRQSSEHANAQSYLMNCLEAMAVQYRRATGKSPQLDPVAKSVVEQFADTHPTLAEAETGAAAVASPVDNMQTPSEGEVTGGVT